jgi:hypothetical protein
MTALRVGQVMMWNGSLWVNAEIGEGAATYDVRVYGATGDGVTDDEDAIQDALDAASAAGGGVVIVPPGEYVADELQIPSGVTLEGIGEDSVLVGCYVTAAGTAGDEIAFIAPAAKGATSISIPATGLTGSWLRLTSCINMQSPDAGIDQLGHDETAHGYLAEFVLVKTGNAGTADLQGALVWPYSNTPGADTYASFTTSTARVMAFHEGGRLRRLKLRGKNAAKNSNIRLDFCRDFRIEDCVVDCEDVTSQLLTGLYCLDCHVVGGTFTGKRTSVPAGSTANPIDFVSSQSCTAIGVTVIAGNQGYDCDAMPNDTTYRGGPSLFCGAIDCRFYDQATDGFTSHWACFGSRFSGNVVIGAPRGGRLRDRGAQCTGNRLINGAGTGIGLLVDNAAVVDANLSDNFIMGYLYGVSWNHGTAGYEDLESLIGSGTGIIARNHVRDCDRGIFCETAYTSAVLVGPRIIDNELIDCYGIGAIYVSSYNNGTIIDGNRISGVDSGDAGIRWEENVKRLHISNNHFYNVHASGYALRGPGASMMTDATTFPGGEAEAEFFIGHSFTDAASPVFNAIVTRSAYAQPSTGQRREINVYDGATQAGNSTYTHPDGFVELEYILIGAGGAGGSGCKGPSLSNRTGGSGGGSGARSVGRLLASALTGTSSVVRVAGAGTGGASVSANGTVGNPGTANASNSTQIQNNSVTLANAGSGGVGLGGALASTSVSGGSGGGGEFTGVTGGNGTNAAGANGSSGVGTAGAGGGGAGLDSSDVSKAGGTGGVVRMQDSAAATVGGTDPGGNGADGASFDTVWGAGFGGGGGGSNAAGAAGKGGKGGKYGAGGGGGGASQDSVGDSGAGGDSGPGLAVLIAYCE